MSEPLLLVERLTAGIDRPHFSPVITNLDLHLDRGETLCVVGESGSGKSFTALSIVKLLPEDGRIQSGRILLAGRDLVPLDEREMRWIRGAEIGFVFQEPMSALNPVFTIGRQIEEVLIAHGRTDRRSARAKAIELLDTVRIPEPHRRIDEYPHQLSGGLRQRALIAIALSCGPRLLIADEPTTALDATIQAQILDLLRDLRAQLGLALLLITHDFGVVAEMADRVMVMRDGSVVEHADVRTLLANAQDPYTRQLLASVPGRR